jgi:beta-phosphoglucomutase-like phosphatase (HAD superfamily)
MLPIAVIFDVDGVLVASPHERAWQEALASLMAVEWREIAAGSAYTPERFTTAVYQQHVAGKPRLSGARAVLDYFDVPDVERRAHVYADRKQQRIEALIDQGAFEAFPDALRLVLALRARGVALAAASSSKNANRFMEQVRLDTFARQAGIGVPSVAAGETLRDSFAVNVCGRDLPQGKPDPALFLLAATELGLPTAHCVVVEDAPVGIQAARAGGMLALGVARQEDAALLEAAGAELVVTSLDEIAVDALVEGRLVRTVTGADRAVVEARRRPE